MSVYLAVMHMIFQNVQHDNYINNLPVKTPQWNGAEGAQNTQRKYYSDKANK